MKYSQMEFVYVLQAVIVIQTEIVNLFKFVPKIVFTLRAVPHVSAMMDIFSKTVNA